MEIMKTIDLYTGFDRMLVLQTRHDFCGLYKSGNQYVLAVTNKATDFNEFIAPGLIIARIISGMLHIAEIDKDTEAELRYRARRYNENIAFN